MPRRCVYYRYKVERRTDIRKEPEMQTTTHTATEKQVSYIETLKANKINQLTAKVGPLDPRDVVEAALAYSLPAPADKADASAQIEALKGGMTGYARTHTAWAQPILASVANAIGNDGSKAPESELVIIDNVGVAQINGLTAEQWISQIVEAQ